MNLSDPVRNAQLVTGSSARKGYVRWFHSFTGIQPGSNKQRVFFIEYLLMNPALDTPCPILGQHPYSKKKKLRPCYLRIKAGAFVGDCSSLPVELHAFYPVSAFCAAAFPFVCEIEDQFFSETCLKGAICVTHDQSRRRSFMCTEGQMQWDLHLNKTIACHTGNALYRPSFHGEGIQTAYQGTVTLNGILYEVSPEFSYGYADKHWGEALGNPRLLLTSCCITSEIFQRQLKHSALLVNVLKPCTMGLAGKPAPLVQLSLEGQDYCFSPAKASSHIRFGYQRSTHFLQWRITLAEQNTVLKLRITCPLTELLPLHYESVEGNLPAMPIYGSGSATGTALLYKNTPEGPELTDTLYLNNVLCVASMPKNLPERIII